MAMSREEALKKIRKCLALSKSANEHEAGNALRQAQKLMQEFQIDIDLMDINEAASLSKALKKPVAWEAWLAMAVASSMQCRIVFKTGSSFFKDVKSQWSFIGVDPAPEIAAYAYEVLYRQLSRARKEFIETKLKRVTIRQNKTRRADLFCEGWVDTVRGLIGGLSQEIPENTAQRIEKYLQKTRGELKSLKPNDRNEGKSLSGRNGDDYSAGTKAGKSAQLNNAMNGSAAPTLIGEASCQ
jgi:hypothetical protein